MDTVTAQSCSQCGQSFFPSELVMIAGSPVCAACKPALLRNLQEGGIGGGSVACYKGFWIRFVAVILDGIIIDLLFTPILLLTLMGSLAGLMAAGTPSPNNPAAAMAIMAVILPKIFLLAFFGLVLVFGYKTFMVGRFGATVGKMAIGAKIVTSDGGQVSYARALGRAAAEQVTGLTFGIGYIMAGFDAKKRALHDRIAGTLVVAK